MKKCDHGFARITFKDGETHQGMIDPTEGMWWKSTRYDTDDVMSAKCDDCGAQLRLGPSNHEPVAVEVRAAELAAWSQFDGLDEYELDCEMYVDEYNGWEKHRLPGAGRVWAEQEPGWLAREIATHDDRETRDADAWPWDPEQTIAEQQDEIAEAIQRMANVAAGVGDALGNVYTDDHAGEEVTPWSCPVDSHECHIRRACTNKCGAKDVPTISNVTVTLDPPGPDLPQLTPAERDELVRILSDVPSDACVCGHAKEDHGGHVDYPGSSACNECEPDACIAYEVER